MILLIWLFVYVQISKAKTFCVTCPQRTRSLSTFSGTDVSKEVVMITTGAVYLVTEITAGRNGVDNLEDENGLKNNIVQCTQRAILMNGKLRIDFNIFCSAPLFNLK